MRTRLLRRASIGALALTLIGGTAALADGILADADALVVDTPHGNGETADQQAGSTVEYDFSALIAQDQSPANDVFPGSLDVTATRGGAWLTSIAPTTTTLTFTGYGAPQAGKISITVPCTASGTQVMTVALKGGISTNTRALSSSKDSVTLNYAITATTPAASSCTVATDNPPVVTVDDVSASSSEGSALNLTATVTDDKTASPALAWTVDTSGADTGASCSFGDATAKDTTVTCTDDGPYTVTLTATDGKGQTGSDSTIIAFDNAAPAVTSTSFGAGNLSCGTDNASLAVSFTDAGSNDTHSVAVDWNNDGTYDETLNDATTGLSIPHTYGAGVHTAALKVIDDDLGFATASAGTKVNYQMSGILQPINTTGSRSLFKYGSTIPLKVQILGCDGLTATGLAPTLSVRMSSADPISGVDESIGSTSSADTGTVLRYSGDGGIYIYNLATKTLGDPTAGYQATVTIPETGQSTQATFGLKK